MTTLARRFLSLPAGISEEKLFKKMISISIAIHIAALLFFGVKASLFPTEALDLDSAIRVDMVGLPDKIAKLPEVKPLPQPMTKPEEKKSTSKVEVKLKEPVKPAPVVLHSK